MANVDNNHRQRVDDLVSLPAAERRSYLTELEELLGEDSLYVQSRAMEAIVELSEDYPNDVVPLLDTIVGHLGDDALGEDAALVIGNVAAADPTVVSDRLPVLVALIDSGGAVTVNVTYALAALSESAADSLAQEGIIAQLYALIDHENPAVRTNVMGVLSAIAAVQPDAITESFDLIRARLSDDRLAVRENTLDTIATLGPTAPATVFDALEELCLLLESEHSTERALVRYALSAPLDAAAELESTALESLVESLSVSDPVVRQQASYLLAEIGAENPESLASYGEELTRRFADEHAAVRGNAIRAMEELESFSPEDVATGRTVLKAALENCGQDGADAPFDPGELRGLANEHHAPEELRHGAREALVRVGTEGADSTA